jgi:hypothetical protein
MLLENGIPHELLTLIDSGDEEIKAVPQSSYTVSVIS